MEYLNPENISPKVSTKNTGITDNFGLLIAMFVILGILIVVGYWAYLQMKKRKQEQEQEEATNKLLAEHEEDFVKWANEYIEAINELHKKYKYIGTGTKRSHRIKSVQKNKLLSIRYRPNRNRRMG